MSGLSTRPGVRLDLEALWAMLPLHLRARDEAAGGVLRALLAVLAEQIGTIEDDLDQRYDDLFIETCREAVVAEIGALIGNQIGWRPSTQAGSNGANGFSASGGSLPSSRAEVANAIAMRRRKGTAAMLEQLGPDVTGWPARLVECFRHLATTSFMNHVRPSPHAFVDLRDLVALDRLGTPFERAGRTVEFRRVDDAAPRWNVPNLALALWPMRSLAVTAAPALRVDSRRWRFSPLGIDEPLFSHGASEPSATHLAEPVNVPAPLQRRALAAALSSEPDRWYGPDRSVQVVIDGVPVAAQAIRICNLSDLPMPPGAGGGGGGGGGTPAWAHMPASGATGVAIDPVLGRIALPTGSSPNDVRVTWHRGLGFAIGGGEYDRLTTLEADPVALESIDASRTIASALAALAAADGSGSAGVAEFIGNERFLETPALRAAAGRDTTLTLRSRNGSRAIIDSQAPIELSGGAGSTIVLDGLLIPGGPLRVGDDSSNGLRRLILRDCTLVPGRRLHRDGTAESPGAPSVIVEGHGVEVIVERSIVGPIHIPYDCELVVRDCIIDATAPKIPAIAAVDGMSPAGSITLEGTTVIGAIHTRLARLISNCILLAEAPAGWGAPVIAERRQQGCVRHSWLPEVSLVPRRHRCVPRVAQPGDESDPEVISARPHLRATRFGDPHYALLAPTTPDSIRRGADDGGEMGVGHHIGRPHRLARLRERLDDSVPAGMRAGILEMF